MCRQNKGCYSRVGEVFNGTKGSFFEEGLASYFAVTYLNHIETRDGAAFITEKTYRLAYDLVARLAKQHSDFNLRLKPAILLVSKCTESNRKAADE